MCGASAAAKAASSHGAWCCWASSACTHLPAERWGWRGAGGDRVLGPFHLPVPFLSHAALASPKRGGDASWLPSGKKRFCFPWCWWVLPAGLQPPAATELLSPGCTRAPLLPVLVPALLLGSMGLPGWGLAGSSHGFLFGWLASYRQRPS